MKPAFDVSQTVSTGAMPPPVLCLRCKQKIERYHLTCLAPLASGAGSGQAMLVCSNCGHVELVAEGSPLLNSLEMASVDGLGDGD
jgi:hypothetical protein